jgi:transcriptional regulator with GAF, ATPase, and Fis domain
VTTPDDDASTLMRAPEAPAAVASTYVVRVAEGPDAGRTQRVDASMGRVLVGQSAACELRLTDRAVSRRHLGFEAGAFGLRATDLDSTNGTFVGTTRLVDGWLAGGETLLLGATALRVDVAGPPAAVPVSREARFGRVLGASVAMRRLHPLLERVAASDVPVVVEGETGTGKELVAEAIHERSARAAKPFVVFDCTAVPSSLLESHLFGHEKGAFTTALASRRGVFEQAHGGTLLIDEIGELDVALQPKLLRALERGEVQRVGGDGWLRVDVRVLAATRRDLDHEVQAGRFREDLFYRLAVARVELPPLRQRAGDVELLARFFWNKLGGAHEIPPAVLARFQDYAWPGNVRELRNAVARRVALGDLAGDAPSVRRAATPAKSASAESALEEAFESILSLDLPLPRARKRLVDAFERRYVERVLARHAGNVTRAAAASGIARRYFYDLKNRAAAPDDDGERGESDGDA